MSFHGWLKVRISLPKVRSATNVPLEDSTLEAHKSAKTLAGFQESMSRPVDAGLLISVGIVLSLLTMTQDFVSLFMSLNKFPVFKTSHKGNGHLTRHLPNGERQ